MKLLGMDKVTFLLPHQKSSSQREGSYRSLVFYSSPSWMHLIGELQLAIWGVSLITSVLFLCHWGRQTAEAQVYCGLWKSD